MATKTTLKLTVGKVHSEYLPALTTLFKMQGGSLQYKLKVKYLRDELNAKQFVALQPVREADALRKLAKTESEKAAMEETFQAQFNLAVEKEIEVNSAKIPFNLVPSEEILARPYTEQTTQPNGQIAYVQGDYTTLIATIYDDLIETNPQ
jgi:hypothetical protein